MINVIINICIVLLCIGDLIALTADKERIRELEERLERLERTDHE